MTSTAAKIVVMPVSVNGNIVDCDFSGPPDLVIDNALFLRRDRAYNVTFELNPAHGVNAFRSQRPFANGNRRCPPPNVNASPPFSLTANTGSTISVHVGTAGNREVWYYRLSFDNGRTCDPIIIRE